MDGTLRRGLLAAVVGLGVWAGLARAEGPPSLPLTLRPGAVLAPLEPPAGRYSPFRAWLQRHGWCCSAHHNDLGCTGGKADLMFIFGSCRTFYGEPCRWGPQPYPPHHGPYPGYGPYSGYGPYPGYGGCACQGAVP